LRAGTVCLNADKLSTNDGLSVGAPRFMLASWPNLVICQPKSKRTVWNSDFLMTNDLLKEKVSGLQGSE
jgi:hypothetical protein